MRLFSCAGLNMQLYFFKLIQFLLLEGEAKRVRRSDLCLFSLVYVSLTRHTTKTPLFTGSLKWTPLRDLPNCFCMFDFYDLWIFDRACSCFLFFFPDKLKPHGDQISHRSCVWTDSRQKLFDGKKNLVLLVLINVAQLLQLQLGKLGLDPEAFIFCVQAISGRKC